MPLALVALILSVLTSPEPSAPARPDSQPAALSRAAQDSLARAIGGEWRGRYNAHGQEADLRLVVARDSAWTVTMILAGGMEIVAHGTDVAAERGGLRWSHSFMQSRCTSWIQQREGGIEGETACEGGGMTYFLRRP